MIAAVSTQRARMRNAQRAGARRQTLQHITSDASRGAPPRRRRSVPRRSQAARSRSRQSLPFPRRG